MGQIGNSKSIITGSNAMALGKARAKWCIHKTSEATFLALDTLPLSFRQTNPSCRRMWWCFTWKWRSSSFINLYDMGRKPQVREPKMTPGPQDSPSLYFPPSLDPTGLSYSGTGPVPDFWEDLLESAMGPIQFWKVLDHVEPNCQVLIRYPNWLIVILCKLCYFYCC